MTYEIYFNITGNTKQNKILNYSTKMITQNTHFNISSIGVDNSQKMEC